MSASLARLLDANANRAREALRVLEDFARFILDDGELSGAFKNMRHELQLAILGFGPGVLEANRATQDDVGRVISHEGERSRADVVEVVIAAGKRLTEALRTIEEYAKVEHGDIAGPIEQLRYRAYELEARLQRRLGSGQRQQWRVCVLITESLCRLPWLHVVDAAIEGGADCIQLREKDLDDGKLLGRATAVVNRCHEAGITAIINDRVDIALLSGADGVHLGQHDLPVEFARRICGRRLTLGVSTENIVQAQAARRTGADYCGVGPMFVSTTKHKDTIAGSAYLRTYLDEIALPHLAIGGIEPGNVVDLYDAGARGIAVCSCVCGSEMPGVVVERLVSLMTEPEPMDVSK